MPLDRDEYSVTNFKNMDDLSSSSLVGVSNSATRPAKMSKIRINEHLIDPHELKIETTKQKETLISLPYLL